MSETKINDLTVIQNELRAEKSQFNTFAKFSYRSCEDIQAAIKPLLLKYNCKLKISDSIEVYADRVYMVATASFTDSKNELTEVKAYARESDSKKGMSSEQVSGSSSSYARKYSLGGLFLIDDQKDADSMDNSKDKKPVNQIPWANDSILNQDETNESCIYKTWAKVIKGNVITLNDGKQYQVNEAWVKFFNEQLK